LYHLRQANQQIENEGTAEGLSGITIPPSGKRKPGVLETHHRAGWKMVDSQTFPDEAEIMSKLKG
jgi:hypothetical protein